MEYEVISGIYAITNLKNNKMYIGQSYNIYDRWKNHIWKLKNNNHINKHLQNSWNKYGEENFKFEIIEKCDQDIINEREIYFIQYYDTFNNGYNLTTGGEGTSGHRLTEEQKNHIGSFHKGKTISEEHKNKLSKIFSGEGNPFYNKHHSEETKNKISQIRKESGVSFRGNNIKAKKVFCDGIIYDCAKDCAEKFQIKDVTLRSYLRGDRKMPEKFQKYGLRYVNDADEAFT